MSDKIKLRAVEPEDVEFIFETEADKNADKWSDNVAPLSKSQILSYALTYDADPFSAGQLRLIAHDPIEKVDIGIIDLYEISGKDRRAYVGITVNPAFRRHGYALKMLHEIIELSKSKLGLKQLLAKVSVENTIALDLFVKAGFKKIALLPSWHRIGDRYHDFHLLNFRLAD